MIGWKPSKEFENDYESAHNTFVAQMNGYLANLDDFVMFAWNILDDDNNGNINFSEFFLHWTRLLEKKGLTVDLTLDHFPEGRSKQYFAFMPNSGDGIKTHGLR
jgi:hypothetical protein